MQHCVLDRETPQLETKDFLRLTMKCRLQLLPANESHSSLIGENKTEQHRKSVFQKITMMICLYEKQKNIYKKFDCIN